MGLEQAAAEGSGGSTVVRPARSHDRLAVRVGESLILIRTDQVDWIEAADNYVYLHCGTKRIRCARP